MTIQLKDSGDATPMEAGGSAQPDNAELTGQNYEQITSALKAKSIGAESDDASEPESQSSATPEGGGEDDLRLMTDEEIKALPPDLQREAKALKKRLLGAYTRKTQDLAEIRRKAEFADRFEADPAFRAQVLRQYGAASQPQAGAQQTQVQPGQVPRQYVELRRQTLPQELHWMAESLALGDYQRDLALYQGYIKPLQDQYQTGQQEHLTRQYQTVAAEFSERNPGWEAHEDDMVEVLEYLKGPDLDHPRWGKKHDLLFSLVTGDKQEAKAMQQAIERNAQAVKSKSVTAGGGRGTAPNLEERIRSAKTDREAWDLARQAAKGARA